MALRSGRDWNRAAILAAGLAPCACWREDGPLPRRPERRHEGHDQYRLHAGGGARLRRAAGFRAAAARGDGSAARAHDEGDVEHRTRGAAEAMDDDRNADLRSDPESLLGAFRPEEIESSRSFRVELVDPEPRRRDDALLPLSLEAALARP